MSRGKKLDIFMGTHFNDDWNQVESKKIKISHEVIVPEKHFLHFSKEKRRGKTVTLVGEFQITSEDATKLLKSLKKKLGCGGSFKNNFMEFQGELKEKIRPLLLAEGFRFKQGH